MLYINLAKPQSYNPTLYLKGGDYEWEDGRQVYVETQILNLHKQYKMVQAQKLLESCRHLQTQQEQ